MPADNPEMRCSIGIHRILQLTVHFRVLAVCECGGIYADFTKVVDEQSPNFILRFGLKQVLDKGGFAASQ